MKPKVSILIPVYNRINFIGECVKSALGQIFTNIEIVIVDNASEDGTWAICEGFARKDSRIRLFRNPTNIGPVRNWIKCLEHSNGDYVKFLYSDDLIAPDYLEKALCFLADKSIGFVYSAAEIGEEKGCGVVAYSNPNGLKFNSEKFLEMLIHQEVPYSPGAGLFRREDVAANLMTRIPTKLSHPFNENGAGPDVLLYALVASKYPTVVGLREPLVFFRAHPGSITICDKNNKVHRGYTAALMWFFSQHNDKRLWVKFAMRKWLTQMVTTRRLLSLEKFLKDYDGELSLADTPLVASAIRSLILKKINMKHARWAQKTTC